MSFPITFQPKIPIKMGFRAKKLQNLIFPILLYRKLNFLIFARLRVIMTSQTPKTGIVGTLFGINVYGRLLANHWYQNKHHTGSISKISADVNGSGGRGLNNVHVLNNTFLNSVLTVLCFWSPFFVPICFFLHLFPIYF